LTHDNVYSIVHDDNNGTWIGTHDGLFHYDGTNWAHYNSSNSGLPYPVIMSLALDLTGTLWIGTYDGGLASFDSIEWQIFDPSNSPLTGKTIRKVITDSKSHIWAIIDDLNARAGLARYDGNEWQVFNSDHPQIHTDDFTGLAEDDEGIYWATSPTGLYKFDGTNWMLYNTNNSSLPNKTLFTIKVDQNNVKWLGCQDSGLVKFDGHSFKCYTMENSGLMSNTIRAISIDQSQNKWLLYSALDETGKTLTRFKENQTTDIKLKSHPTSHHLLQNYPNPFNGYTTLQYELKSPGRVSIKIFNLAGQEIATLLNTFQSAGKHKIQWKANQLPSGIYFCNLQTDARAQTIKMILQK
jgi:hypothetical protein